MVGILEDVLEFYGYYKVKIDINKIMLRDSKGKVVLVIVMSLILVGEGKLIVIVGLVDVFYELKKNVMVVLCEFVLGLIFGIKGGVIGGGYV